MLNALHKAKVRERDSDLGPVKRRPNEFLQKYLAVRLYDSRALRAADGYTAKSYNLSKQVLRLVDHVFVQYPVPLFLYRSILSFEGLELVFGDKLSTKPNARTRPQECRYADWFFAVAQGKSLSKLAKGILTKKEAHWLLQAPATNRIEANILWARAAAAGVPSAGCNYLVDKIDRGFLNRIGHRLPDVLRFYAQGWHELRGYDRDEITDFIRAASENPDFSFKGRTVGSMRKLSNEWHRTYYSGRVAHFQSWRQMFPAWQVEQKGMLVRAFELTNNRALAQEGTQQRHCVYTYTSSCLQGRSRIVSMRWLIGEAEERRLTIEISPASRQIVQIRGRLNRMPQDEEMRFVRRWAGEHGLTLCAYSTY